MCNAYILANSIVYETTKVSKQRRYREKLECLHVTIKNNF